jgi:hypothetical protein
MKIIPITFFFFFHPYIFLFVVVVVVVVVLTQIVIMPILDNEEYGTFLIRQSSLSLGDYVLSVLYDDAVVHYQIRKHGEDAFFL